MNKLYSFPGCRITAVTRPDAASLHIIAERRSGGARCSSCGWLSMAVHSRYSRRPADLSLLGRAVLLELAIRRFYCRNPSCPRRTFAERLPALLAPHARRTRRKHAVSAAGGLLCRRGGQSAAGGTLIGDDLA
jgi:DNA-directed RNA polymerase subunit N (RpoN/RPB10)